MASERKTVDASNSCSTAQPSPPVQRWLFLNVPSAAAAVAVAAAVPAPVTVTMTAIASIISVVSVIGALMAMQRGIAATNCHGFHFTEQDSTAFLLEFLAVLADQDR